MYPSLGERHEILDGCDTAGVGVGVIVADKKHCQSSPKNVFLVRDNGGVNTFVGISNICKWSAGDKV